MFDPFDRTPATRAPERMGYIKAMRSEDVAFLSADAPLLAPGHQVFVVCTTDGLPILLAESHESALADANSHQIETVSLH
jgi:hypothetical protein